MKKRLYPFRSRGRDHAFSLVEVALALGVVGFALVGIVGALPVAMNNERLSITQTRAASVATTLFARMRAQPFSAILCSDEPNATTINLNTLKTDLTAKPDGPRTECFAVFDETAVTASTLDARRLHFYSDVSRLTAGAPCYKVVVRFNNSPAGMPAPNTSASGLPHASGNAVEASVFKCDRPSDTNYLPKSQDVYHFNTVIANRTD